MLSLDLNLRSNSVLKSKTGESKKTVSKKVKRPESPAGIMSGGGNGRGT